MISDKTNQHDRRQNKSTQSKKINMISVKTNQHDLRQTIPKVNTTFTKVNIVNIGKKNV